MRGFGLAAMAASVVLAGGARAEVVDATPAGFQVKETAEIAAPAAKVWAALGQVGGWWNSAHSWSHDAKNLTLELKPGGCWCEALPDGGGARHMAVIFVAPGKTAILDGTLGPLMFSGATGHLVWSLAEKDGYTLYMTQASTWTVLPVTQEKLPFDLQRDFAPIGLVTDVPMILVARPDFPAKDLKELVAYLRQEGDKITFGTAGVGSASHLCGLMFMSATGTKLTTISYKGGGPALNDAIAYLTHEIGKRPVGYRAPSWDFSRDTLDLGGARHPLEQNREFIATQPGDGVR